jgi:hypothetical protein
MGLFAATENVYGVFGFRLSIGTTSGSDEANTDRAMLLKVIV